MFHKFTHWRVSCFTFETINNFKLVTIYIKVGATRDHAGNFSKKSLQTVISRLDKDCKLICIGSNRQIDNNYVNKYTNGLRVLLDCSSENNPEINMFATRLDRVVRGPITEWAERVFS